jgi:50S ribosomal subunit-associated GTPase HflX
MAKKSGRNVVFKVTGEQVTVANKIGTVNMGMRKTINYGALSQQLEEMSAVLPQVEMGDEPKLEIGRKIQEVQEQVKEPEPDPKTMLEKLNEVKEVVQTVTVMAGAGEAITKLMPMVEKAIAWLSSVMR